MRGGRQRAPGRPGAMRMDDVDPLGGNQLLQLGGVAPQLQRIHRVVEKRNPFAAGGLQFPRQRAGRARHQSARAALHQADGGFHRHPRGRLVAQRGDDLQNGGVGERARQRPLRGCGVGKNGDPISHGAGRHESCRAILLHLMRA
jgi:hypothetical protein